VPKKIIMGEIGDILLGPLFLIMCLTNIKNIYHTYYPRNWDNFHKKTNYILVENETTKLILILSFLKPLAIVLMMLAFFSISMLFRLDIVSLAFLFRLC